MTAIDIVLTATATFALAYGVDALITIYRHHRTTRRHP